MGRTSAIVVGVATVVMLLTGCTRITGEGAAEPPSPSAPATVPRPTPTESPEPDQMRTGDGQPLKPAADQVLASCALGPLLVGMKKGEFEGTGLAGLESDPELPPVIIFRPSRDVFIGGTPEGGITGFLVKDPQYQTPEGIRPGVSTVADLQQAYGDRLLRVENDRGQPYFLVQDGDCGYFFQTDPFADDDVIISMVAGRWTVVARQEPNSGFFS